METDKTVLTTRTYDLCARAFEERFMDVALYRDSLTEFARHIPAGSRVLDLGCGPGNVSVFLSGKVPGIEIQGFDLSSEMVKLARNNLPSARFTVGDIRRLDLTSESFDHAAAAFSIPFLYNGETETFLGDVACALKPGGLLYLSFMEGKGHGFETTSFSSGETLFINYYEEDFIRSAAGKAGFSIRKLSRQDYPEEDGSITTDMILLLEKETA